MMLDHLRHRVEEVLTTVTLATLSSYGPAKLQATLLPCESIGLRLYMLLPATSDHLLNLESQPDVMVTTPGWHLRGTAVILDMLGYPQNLNLLNKPEARWSRLIDISPRQLNIRRSHGWGFQETIDIEM